MITKKNPAISKEKAIKENIGFVKKYVDQMINKYPHLKPYREDLIHAGIEGILVATKKYDEEKEVKFLTYASYHIKDKIYKEIKKLQIAGLNQAPSTSLREKKIFKLLKEKKSTKEIADTLGLKERTVEKYIINKISSCESLDEEIKLKSGETVSKHEIIPSPFSMQEVERDIDNQKLRNILKKAINESLDNREKYIIYHRIVSEETKTLERLAIELKISRERVRQIEKKALKKLKKYLQEKNISLENFIY